MPTTLAQEVRDTVRVTFAQPNGIAGSDPRITALIDALIIVLQRRLDSIDATLADHEARIEALE